jgi:hypothetical protein
MADVVPAPIPAAWLARLRPIRTRSTSVATGQMGIHGDPSLPLGLDAQEFLEHGVPWGQQRARALSACRNLLARGTSVEETVELIWAGLRSSPQEPGRRPWTRSDAEAIVLDLQQREPPPLRDTDADLTTMLSQRRVRRLQLAERALSRARDLSAQARPRTYDIRQVQG